jgi:hypothetical protein
MITTELVSPENIGTKIDFEELKNGCSPVAFFVNGFGGCAPCITRNLHKKLQLEQISVYDLDWNDIYIRRQSVYLSFSDSTFVNDMVKKVIPAIKPGRKILMIGHSFGSDTLLKVAQLIMPRKIAFLGVLDTIEKFGKRTTKVVPSNVEYFYNRWTKYPSLPRNIPAFGIPGTTLQIGIALNPNQSGELLIDNHSTYSDQKEQSYSYNADGSPILVPDESHQTNNVKERGKSGDKTRHQIITHGCKYAIYKDLYIQQQMWEIIKQML